MDIITRRCDIFSSWRSFNTLLTDNFVFINLTTDISQSSHPKHCAIPWKYLSQREISKSEISLRLMHTQHIFQVVHKQQSHFSRIFLKRLRSNRATFMSVVKVLRDFYYKFSFISFIPKPTKRVFMKFSSQ